jgi:hypothetical protein
LPRISAWRSSSTGQPFEDRRQRARPLARRDHRAVERRKALRLARHRVGQAAALDDAGMDAVEDRADRSVLLGLARDRAQRFFERRHHVERCELAREQGQRLAELIRGAAEQQRKQRRRAWAGRVPGSSRTT